jgi:SAM-dependent methyltransferase
MNAGENSSREKWEARYAAPDYQPDTGPEPFLVEKCGRPHSGRALCLAAGGGRNAVYLAEQGWEVTAVDISARGLAWCRELAAHRGVQLTTLQTDLLSFDMGEERYDLITSFYYYQPELFPRVKDALCPGGQFILQTFSIDQIGFGGGPRNPAHLVEPNALLRSFADFRIRYYEDVVSERLVRDERQPAALVRLLAEKNLT